MKIILTGADIRKAVVLYLTETLGKQTIGSSGEEVDMYLNSDSNILEGMSIPIDGNSELVVETDDE